MSLEEWFHCSGVIVGVWAFIRITYDFRSPVALVRIAYCIRFL